MLWAWRNHPWEETRDGLVSTPEMRKTAQEFNTHLENDFVCPISSMFEVLFCFFHVLGLKKPASLVAVRSPTLYSYVNKHH